MNNSIYIDFKTAVNPQEVKMTPEAQRAVQNMADIPALSHKEAGTMALVEIDRFTNLLETLSEEDWSKPTYCTLWNVHQMVSHQAGAYAGNAKWGEFKRQWAPIPQPKPGQLAIDAINEIQVADRANATPAQLIAELREVGPKAVATRQSMPAFVRGLRFDMGLFLTAWRPSQLIGAMRRPYGQTEVYFDTNKHDFQGLMRLDYITDLVYIRDTWMHRIDICLATGSKMHLTDAHDGRMLALVMRDLGHQLKQVLGKKTVAYHIPGVGGGTFKIGPASSPDATIQMDLLYFNVLASARISPDAAKTQGLISVSGDATVANLALNHMSPLAY